MFNEVEHYSEDHGPCEARSARSAQCILSGAPTSQLGLVALDWESTADGNLQQQLQATCCDCYGKNSYG